jgi:hypothetical protein
MALRKPRQEEVRAKIQAGNLINRLEKHINGEIELQNSQLKAIEILLDRSIPKLSAIEVSGNEDNPLQAHVKVEFVRQTS